MRNQNEGILNEDFKALVVSKESKHYLTTTPRFLTDAVRGAGFDFSQSITEFLDNSLDSGAKKIEISTKLNNRGYYEICIKDNGKGISKEKILDVVKEVGHGSTNDYNSSSISNFGVGMKYAMINLCEEGEVKIETFDGEWESKISMIIGVEEQPYLTDPIHTRKTGTSYTKIYIPNLVTNRSKINSNQITGLLKLFGAQYFPHTNQGNELSITLKHKNKTHEVMFTDPLYRNHTEEEGVLVNDDSCNINSAMINIRGRYFTKSFNESKINPFDIRQGQGGAFSSSRSGIYFRLNGRYITLGNAEFFKGSDQQKRNRLRIEVDVDRELIPIMGIGFNKSRISISRDNELLKEFFEKLDAIVTWGEKKYTREPKPMIDPVTQTERDLLNKDLSAISKRTAGDGIKNMLPKLPEKKKEDKEKKGTKVRPKGLEYNKNNVEIQYVSRGEYNPILEFGRESGKTVIELNTDHPFYKEYSSLDSNCKMVIDMMFFSLVEGITATKTEHGSTEADSIREEVIGCFSSRLKKWFSQKS